MSKEAMKQVLEALKDATLHIWLGDKKGVEANVRAHKAIKALEEALAKQEQGEPVAWLYKDTGVIVRDFRINPKDVVCLPLYTTPQPAQKPWVGLTDDDKVLIKHDANFNQFMTAGEYADRVQALTEARLKDKNT